MNWFRTICCGWVLLFLGSEIVLAQSKVTDFETQVIPVLTKMGCNSGACHGAAIGRGGFKLSLLGYDPDADYESMIHEFEGRRVHRLHPEKSLLLQKPSLELPHEGGLKLSRFKNGYKILYDWIKAGAPRQSNRQLTGIVITPGEKHLKKIGDQFQVTVTAQFSDGQKEDVTEWTVLKATDESAISIRNNRVTVLRRGIHNIMIRFLGEVDSLSVIVPLQDDFEHSKRPSENFIDDAINKRLDELHLPNSPTCEDTTFVRRAFLDLIGTLPTPVEVKNFLGSNNPNKRAQLVESLLSRPEYADYWAYKWGDLLRIESKALGEAGVESFHTWLKKQIAEDTPLDHMANAMIMSLGDSAKNGPVNFHRVPRNPGEEAEYVSRVFMGVRLQCANCHNHPLDQWTQDDYHGMAALFAQLQRGQTIQLKDRGEVIHPRTGESARPRIPGERFLAQSKDLREPFAKWLTAKENPFFARNAINRIWRDLMGRGLVEPFDDHRATNPPSHPELLDKLAENFSKHGFSVKHTIRSIMASAAYQRSSLATEGNENDRLYYSKYIIRPLPPTVVVDAVSHVTGITEALGDAKSAIALKDTKLKSETLDLLGRCSRQEDCEANSMNGGLTLALHTLHGPWLNAKVSSKKGRLHRLIAARKSNQEILAELYQVAFSRMPTTTESNFWGKQLASLKGQQRILALEDFFWALLNSTEFRTNH